MADSKQDQEYSDPVYKRGNYLVSALATVVVLLIAGLVIWRIHANAVTKIQTSLQQQAQQGVADEQRQEFALSVTTDPVGFDLANFMQANYPTIVLLTYFALAALGLAAVVRFVIFMISSARRKQYYPDDAELEHFLHQKFQTWDDFYHYTLKQNHRQTRFWRILKDSVMVTNASGRYDHLYLHFRNRIDRITESMDEMSMYDSIATASPAAGFFGTLIGFLYIFSQGQSAANLSHSLEFAVGLKVAIITSLWGLLNLGTAIAAAYFSRRVIDQIHHQMVVRAVAVCEIVESLQIPQQIHETEAVLAHSKEHAGVRS
ncbi:MAG: MotA/TolQ/ExbB proton channel family protein [candidate division Zixibacteria bacterium]|nr:MotA/TolQ/ExbB proton channel family protein [candidate division Zixibacteria bacterium]